MDYTAMMVDGFLAHHGVKGMKWGHRKRRDSSGRRRSRHENPRNMTDEEIQSKIRRYKLEQDYYTARKNSRNPSAREATETAKDTAKLAVRRAVEASAAITAASVTAFLLKKKGLPVKGFGGNSKQDQNG